MLGIRHYRKTAIDLFQGDITSYVCDGIVNAANSRLLGGGGVDGAIHKAGGPSILEECRVIGHCETGDAVITAAGLLPAKHIIHTVGPVWQGGKSGEAMALASCHHKSLQLALQHKLQHIAFPAISTGVYGYPIVEASKVAIQAVKDFLDTVPPQSLRRVSFVLFELSSYKIFQASLFGMFPEKDEA